MSNIPNTYTKKSIATDIVWVIGNLTVVLMFVYLLICTATALWETARFGVHGLSVRASVSHMVVATSDGHEVVVDYTIKNNTEVDTDAMLSMLVPACLDDDKLSDVEDEVEETFLVDIERITVVHRQSE